MEIPASFHWWRMEEKNCEQLTEKKKIISVNPFINSINKNVCPLQDVYPSEKKTYVHTKNFTLMFIAALSVATPKRK